MCKNMQALELVEAAAGVKLGRRYELLRGVEYFSAAGGGGGGCACVCAVTKRGRGLCVCALRVVLRVVVRPDRG
jgi:hypothetical protein